MGSCLKTQLRESIDAFLPKLGEIEITVVDPSVFNFYVNTVSEDAIVRAPSAVIYYVDNNGNKVGNAMSQCNINDGVYDKGITVADGYTGKLFYNAKYLGQSWTLSGGYADFSLISNFVSLKSTNTKGGTLVRNFPPGSAIYFYFTGSFNNKLSFFESEQPNVASVSISSKGGSNYSIDVAELIKNFTALQFLTYVRGYFNNMTADNLADFGKIRTLNFLSHNNKYSWTIEKFVANKRSVGETSGTCIVEYGSDDGNGGVCSFNGQKLTGSPATVTWDASNINVTY